MSDFYKAIETASKNYRLQMKEISVRENLLNLIRENPEQALRKIEQLQRDVVDFQEQIKELKIERGELNRLKIENKSLREDLARLEKWDTLHRPLI